MWSLEHQAARCGYAIQKRGSWVVYHLRVRRVIFGPYRYRWNAWVALFFFIWV